MALEMREKNTIGCAYYVARDETLYFMEDTMMGTLDLVEQIKLFIEPTVVLLSLRAFDETIKQFDPHFSNGRSDEESDPFRLPYRLELRPPSGMLVTYHLSLSACPRVQFTA